VAHRLKPTVPIPPNPPKGGGFLEDAVIIPNSTAVPIQEVVKAIQEAVEAGQKILKRTI